MSPSRLATIAILGLTTITAAGLAYHQYRRAETLTTLLRAAEAKPQPVLPTKPTARQSITAGPTDSTPPPAPFIEELETEAADRPDPGPRENRNRDRGDMAARFATLMADPEYAEAYQVQQRSRLDRNYAELFAQLNLPPATLAKLQGLLVEKQNAMRDVFMAAREEGINGRENREELRGLVELTQSEIDADIAATIGSAAFETLQNYEQTGQQRALVEQLESRLSYSSAPLNSAQAQALTAILAETAPGSTAGTNRRGGGRGVSITDTAIDRAQAVLSPDQLQSLTALQAEQQAGQKLAEAMRQQAQEFRNANNAARDAVSAGGPGGGG